MTIFVCAFKNQSGMEAGIGNDPKGFIEP